VPPATVASLRLLAQLRWIAIGGQVAALAVAGAAGAALPWPPLAAVVGALIVLNVATATRLRRARPPTHAEVAAHLAADLAAFTALIALTGGGANPFVWLYVLHRRAASCCRGRSPVQGSLPCSRATRAPRRRRGRSRLPAARRCRRRWSLPAAT